MWIVNLIYTNQLSWLWTVQIRWHQFNDENDFQRHMFVQKSCTLSQCFKSLKWRCPFFLSKKFNFKIVKWPTYKNTRNCCNAFGNKTICCKAYTQQYSISLSCTLTHTENVFPFFNDSTNSLVSLLFLEKILL